MKGSKSESGEMDVRLSVTKKTNKKQWRKKRKKREKKVTRRL